MQQFIPAHNPISCIRAPICPSKYRNVSRPYPSRHYIINTPYFLRKAVDLGYPHTELQATRRSRARARLAVPKPPYLHANEPKCTENHSNERKINLPWSFNLLSLPIFFARFHQIIVHSISSTTIIISLTTLFARKLIQPCAKMLKITRACIRALTFWRYKKQYAKNYSRRSLDFSIHIEPVVSKGGDPRHHHDMIQSDIHQFKTTIRAIWLIPGGPFLRLKGGDPFEKENPQTIPTESFHNPRRKSAPFQVHINLPSNPHQRPPITI